MKINEITKKIVELNYHRLSRLSNRLPNLNSHPSPSSYPSS